MAETSFLRRLLIAIGLVSGDAAEAVVGEGPRAQAPRPELQVDERKIPASARERVALIRSLLDELDARRRERPAMGELGELERMRSTHLPRLLQSYIEIPAEHRGEVFRETGRSASYLLNDRLDKMIARLREISKMLAQGDIDSFTQNIGFIDSQYGPGFSPFDS
jgi:hypothetical protein